MFAWMPARIKDEVIWLARYEILEIFTSFEVKAIDLVDKKEHIVKVVKWTETGKRFIPIESIRI